MIRFPFRPAPVLLVSIFLVAASSFFYELLISTLTSYFLGNAVLHFSVTIGLFLFFIGVGSFLSKYFSKNLERVFVWIELIIASIGGLSIPLLYLVFVSGSGFYLWSIVCIALIGTLTGFEIPFLTRIAKDRTTLQNPLADILGFDYLGALAASLLFPLLLLPMLGLMQTAFLVALLNTLVALVFLRSFWGVIGSVRTIVATSVVVLMLLIAGAVFSERLGSYFERRLYQDPILVSKQTPYQKIVLTAFKDDVRLYLDGSLQFSSLDEYRYHEPLVHIPLALVPVRERVLVLGGGDGLALRELVRYPDIDSITLVDLDEQMTLLAKTHPTLRRINKDAFFDPRVHVVHQDAFAFLETAQGLYDAIIIDLPDPSNVSLGKLYSVEFYRLLNRHLSETGMVITQASSPFFARQAYWSVHASLLEVFPNVIPLQNYVPSFGPWGFMLASRFLHSFQASVLPEDLRYLSEQTYQQMRQFDQDLSPAEVQPNYLNRQTTVEYYQESWSRVYQD